MRNFKDKSVRFAVFPSLFLCSFAAVPARATVCFYPDFIESKKPLAEREREARQYAVDEVRGYKAMFWGRPTQYQCLGKVGKDPARIDDYEVTKWAKGGPGPSAQALRFKHALSPPDWCSEGSGTLGGGTQFHVLLPVRPKLYEQGYPKAVLDKLDGVEVWECTPDIQRAMNEPAWDAKKEPDTTKRYLWNLYREAVRKEIDKLK